MWERIFDKKVVSFHTFLERDGHVKQLERLKFGKSHVKFPIDNERFSSLKKLQNIKYLETTGNM